MEKEVQSILESLSPLERKVLPFLELGKIQAIEQQSGLDFTSVLRALQFLANKKIVEVKTKETRFVSLDINGIEYTRKGLPERRLLSLIIEKNMMLNEAKKASNLSDNEFQVSLGTLKSKRIINLVKDKIILTANKEEAIKKFPEEKFLESLPLALDSLKDEEKKIFEKLRLRKNMIFVEEKKEISFEINEVGKNVIAASKGKDAKEFIEQVTPEIIKDEKWKEKKFRVYDLNVNAPLIMGGKRHPYTKFLHEIRQELIALGFKEAAGPLVETSFWNCDALFMPQNHPARGIHDLYFLKPEQGEILDKELFKKIRATHENGWKTESDGWKIDFNEEESRKLVLRSQGTPVSARILASNPEIPGKYFVIARVFRPDIIDAKHLPEFNQLEGIVVGKEVNFLHLLGLLKLFAERIAKIKEIKFCPSYFPFTEPSVELIGLHPTKGWIELGGAGIFRPEVTIPLGLDRDVKVIAWGIGIDRLFMLNQGLDDIRNIFSQDINYLRGTRIK